MYQFLFKSRWIALGFVALTLLSVYLLVGGREDGVLSQAADHLASQQGANAGRIAELEAPPESGDDDSDAVYMDDEELIDEADGFDPTPQEARVGEPEVSDDESASFDRQPAEQRYAPDGVEIIQRGR
mgnify:CR=1 FL=1